MSSPFAIYQSGSDSLNRLVPGPGPYTTQGKTSGPSEHVINAGMSIDKDKPSDAKDTYLGNLRSELTNLQDVINEFLTKKMQIDKNNSKDVNIDDLLEPEIDDDE